MMIPKANKKFYEKQTDSSRIKANIVAAYFKPYCNIIDRNDIQSEIRYIDLFAGPGLYEDKSPSTPFMITDQIVRSPKLAKKVRLLFNDKYRGEELKANFQKRYNSGMLLKEPRFGEKTIGEDAKIDDYLCKEFKDSRGNNKFPTLLFVDPFGYKGINPKVLSQFMKSWGNEIFLFVNIKRIHAAIKNNKFDQLMEMLFPTSIHEVRKERSYTANVYQRLNLIMDKLGQEFVTLLGKDIHIASFKFQEEDSIATSHYLMHLTKHPKGYELIKQIFHDFDNIGAELEKEGTYTFDAKKMDASSQTFSFSDQNIENLANELLLKYKNATIFANKLFQEHHPTSKYCGTHYVKALRKLVKDGKAQSEFTDNVSHNVSVLLTDSCKIKFI